MVDQLDGALQVARGEELLAERVSLLTCVAYPQRVPHRLSSDAVATALIAEEVPPTTRPGDPAAGVSTPSDRAGACDQRDSVRELCCGEDELGVMDDPERCRGIETAQAACDELPQP